MGEEFAASTPFLFFCDFDGELGAAVREGRRREFASFPEFADDASRERIPDPGAEQTFLSSKLDWDEIDAPGHADWLAHYKSLIALRAREIVPRLGDRAAPGTFRLEGEAGIAVDWTLGDGSRLHLRANFGCGDGGPPAAPGRMLHVEGAAGAAWSGAWSLEAP
jgi:1,4-alpha-glucan branching enzyme